MSSEESGLCTATHTDKLTYGARRSTVDESLAIIPGETMRGSKYVGLWLSELSNNNVWWIGENT